MFYRTIIKVLSKFLKRSLNISVFDIQLTKRRNPDRSGDKIEDMDMQTNLEFDFWSGKSEFLDPSFTEILRYAMGEFREFKDENLENRKKVESRKFSVNLKFSNIYS